MSELDATLETLARGGYVDVGFRLFRGGEARDGGRVAKDTWFCRAWRAGTTDIIGENGLTPSEALAAVRRGAPRSVSARSAQWPHDLARPPLARHAVGRQGYLWGAQRGSNP